MVSVVTVQVGDRYPDIYVRRLHHMVARHLHRPHRLIVYSDRERNLPPEVEVRDCAAWGLEGYFNKLRLFDRREVGSEPFLFLDHTLVIRDGLDGLVTRGERSGASLVAVQDWNYPTINSSVMWVRPDRHTQQVWDDFDAGIRYPGGTPSDQNYTDAVFRSRFPERLDLWEDGLITSYRVLRKLAAKQPAEARRKYEASVIVKFHGHPKPHEVLRPWLRLDKTILRHPLRPRLWRYLGSEIREHWY